LDLSRDKPVAITCTVGHRAGLGVSLLLREGFHDVRNLLGGMSAWQALELPVET
jgi:hydroxyacylglutathione hydrolase